MKYLNPSLYDRIVGHARRTHPFYGKWLPEGEPAPLLTRRVVQEHNAELLNGRPVTWRTSGSTGVAVSVHMTPERIARNAPAMNLFMRHLGGPLVRTQIVYPQATDNPVPIVPIFTPVAEQAAVLLHNFHTYGATAVITYPSNAELLARHVLEHGLDMGFIRRLGMISESIDPAQRAIIQKAFPAAKLWSTYSSMEFGLIAFECPYVPGFHHASTDKLGFEILDEHDRECGPGQIGRLVLTDYYNEEMPLIRYEIGDLAAFGECPCGRIRLPALQHILGKVHGSLKHRDGRRIPFLTLPVALRELPGMRQFQVIQQDLEHFTVKVSSARDLGPEIRAAFAAEFGYEPRIDIEPVEHIPRDPNGKFYATICRI